jgi:hypothetical protein
MNRGSGPRSPLFADQSTNMNDTQGHSRSPPYDDIMTDTSYTANAQVLAELLTTSSPSIVVPDWQRSYSWKSDQVDVFWADLMRFSKTYPDRNIDNHHYFLGSVVIVSSSTTYLLLDGQQRLATATVLLAALRETRRNLAGPAAIRLQSKFIADWDDASSQMKYSLTLNRYDRDYFRRAIQAESGAAVKPKLKSHGLLRGALDYFVTEISTATAALTPEDALAWNLRVQKVLLDHVSLVVVKSTDEDNAASVFESLNDRGIGLSTPDLLRNLLLRKANNEVERESVVASWLEVFTIFEQGSVEQFLRHYWVSVRGDVKTRSLYRDIKSVIEAENTDPVVFSQTLARSAEDYRKLKDATDGTEGVRRTLEGINQLAASVVYPGLLSALSVRDASEEGFEEFVHTLLVLYVRHSVILGRDNSKLETVVYSTAKALREGGSFGDATQLLQEFAPTLAEFARAFETATLSRTESAKYILEQLELHSRGTDELVLGSNKRVHLEHIYPQTPAVGERLDNHATLVNRIGNHTLLDHRLNMTIKNSRFAEKKAAGYANSELNLTKALLSVEVNLWGKDEIASRQKNLAEQAARVWAWNDEEFELWEATRPDTAAIVAVETSPEDLPEDIEELADVETQESGAVL